VSWNYPSVAAGARLSTSFRSLVEPVRYSENALATIPSVVPLRPNSLQTQVASLQQRGCLTYKNFTADSLSASPRATATAGAPGSPILNQKARNLSNKHATFPYISISKCSHLVQIGIRMRNDLIHRNCQSKSVGRYVTEDFRKHHEICAFQLSVFGFQFSCLQSWGSVSWQSMQKFAQRRVSDLMASSASTLIEKEYERIIHLDEPKGAWVTTNGFGYKWAVFLV